MFKNIIWISLACTLAFPSKIFACSIFTAAKKTEVLAAGNEDWSDPFSKMWVSPRTKDRYGSINFGHTDFQCQTAINEYGLFYDYAATERAEGKLMASKEAFNGDLFFEIIGKCKTIEEALVYLKKYQFGSAYCQVLIGDASGRSIIVNQDILLESQKDYTIATNFNACEMGMGNHDCKRFDILEESLSSSSEISVSLFTELLSRVHQEGKYPTQYSYVFDLKRGIIHLYAFHNFNNKITLNLKEEIDKGFQLYDLKSLFPIAFEEEKYRLNHPDFLQQAIVAKIKANDAQAGIHLLENYQKENPQKDISQEELLWEASIALLQETWVNESKGTPFMYWWYTQEYTQWKSQGAVYHKLLSIFNLLEQQTTEESNKKIGIYEMKALLSFILDHKKQAKVYFEKTLAKAPKESGNYQRAKIFLEALKTS